MLVKNVKGTGQLKCGCGSWLNHWEKGVRSTATYCAVSGCLQMATVGAHVIKVGSYDLGRYIVPFCGGHNGTDSDLEINDFIPLVSANQSLTCLL